jgi:HSP20 family protein
MSTNLTKGPQTTPERVHQRLFVAPLVDVYENQDELLLVADLPGAAKETMNVNLDKGLLTIEARRPEGASPGTLVAGEHQPRDYHRAFAMPQGIDGSKIDARLANGILRVRLPKSDAHKPRRIDVKAG